MLGTSVKRGAFCLTQRLYSFLFNSLRSKSSRLVSEQRSRKTEERDFRFGLPEKWKRGEGKGKEGNLPYLSFFPTPPRSFTRAIFHAVSDSCSSFFAPKPEGNACYAGHLFKGVVMSMDVETSFHYRGLRGRVHQR